MSGYDPKIMAAHEAKEQRLREAQNNVLRHIDTPQAKAQIRNNKTEIEMIKKIRETKGY